MSNLKDLLNEDVDSVFFDNTEFAETATYNGVAVSVIANVGGLLSRNPNVTDHSYENSSFTVRKLDVSKPKSGDVIVYNGKSYAYEAIEAETTGTFRLRFAANNSGVSSKGVHLL